MKVKRYLNVRGALLVALVIAVVGTILENVSSPGATQPTPTAIRSMPGEIVLLLKQPADTNALNRLLAERGARIVSSKAVNRDELFLVIFVSGASETDLNQLGRDIADRIPGVLSVGLNRAPATIH